MGGTVPAAQPAEEPREFKLAWALVASVVVHLLFVALSYLTPVFDSRDAAETQDDAVLEFTFAPPTEDSDLPTETARGEVPFETPLAPPPMPQEQPAPTVDDAPGTDAVTVPPEETVAPQPQMPPPEPMTEPVPDEPQQPEPVDPTDPADDAPSEDDPSDGIDTPAEEPGTQAPERPEGDLVPGQEMDPQDAAPEEPKRTLDISKALSSFDQSMSRARAQRPPTVQGNPGPQNNVFTPREVGAPPVQGGPYGILEFSSRDYDWSEYARQIYWEILRAWYNRLYQTAADFEKWAYNNRSWVLDHSSGIEFIIERSGNVSGIQLLSPSGCPPLDGSALDALSEVILPQLPADFPRDQELVRARFIATGDIRYLRQSLRAAKAAGRF